jgi:hypothetical protein
MTLRRQPMVVSENLTGLAFQNPDRPDRVFDRFYAAHV